MGFLDFFILNNSFYCIFCKKHIRLSGASFTHKNIGVCNECSKKISVFPLAPIPIQTKSCNTIVSVLPYNEMLKSALHDYKFYNNPGYANIFADYIITYLEQFDEAHNNGFISMFDLVVPVPLSKQRLRERGYNQSALISKIIAKHFGIEENENALIKIKHTKQQSLVPHDMRLKNVSGAYKADKDIVSGKRILLFDDIFTTGNTAEACAKALISSEAANVSILTLANRPYYMHTAEYYNFFKMV